MNQRKKFNAFTLAEVLITIGIIGVVAALTIPTLLKLTQDMEFKSAAMEAFSKANQVLNQMKIDGTFTPGVTNDYTFKNDFMSYMKVAQNCGNADECVTCGNSDVYHSRFGNQGYLVHWCDGQFSTIDGMFWAFTDGGPEFGISVDVNGYQKKPNVIGRDTFMFQVMSNGTLVPEGAPGTWYNSGHCDFAAYSTDLGCMYNVVRNYNY